MKDLKEIVKEKYGNIVKQKSEESCCTPSCCGPSDDGSVISIMAEDYTKLEGYNQDADLNLGCGLPTEFAMIKPGQTVVDLGSGAGNDCFIARAETGAEGMVYGVDFTPGMIDKARENVKKLGFENVKFVYGDIEEIPLDSDLADVVVSNCVFNLVPDKVKAFRETYRILAPGGHFSISDIVLEGDLPEGLQEAAEMYAGCVSGAIQKEDYIDIVRGAGFQNIKIQKQRPITLPEDLLSKYLSKEEIGDFNVKQGIYSITVYAEK